MASRWPVDFSGRIVLHVVVQDTSFISHNSVTTAKFVIFFQERPLKVLSSIILYECNHDTTALQRRVLQTALWNYTC